MGAPPGGTGQRAYRVLSGVMAGLYFVVVGMLLYFRLGPFQRVLDRFEAEGSEIPAWFPLVFNLGAGLIGLFLGFRGVLALRKAFGSGSRPSRPRRGG